MKLTGQSVEQFRRNHADGLLAAGLVGLGRAHASLASAEANVAYHLARLHQFSGGQRPADATLLARMERALHHLGQAVERRDTAAVIARRILEPLEASATAVEERVPELSPADRTDLLALARGAKLHQNLVSQRLSVATATGTRVAHPTLQRLEKAGLVHVDRSHSLQAGQPVTVTDLGRRALTGQTPGSATAPAPVGAWPVLTHHR